MPEDLAKKDGFLNKETTEVPIEKEEERIEKEEKVFEERPELEEKKESASSADKEKPEKKTEATVPGISPPPAASVSKSPTFKNIENILEEDLSDVYFGMSPKKQKEFKEVGEETAGKIEKLISAVKFSTNKVFNLIKKWLKIIPSINKFFLEQEAKIKTDKILSLREKK